ncbi:MAG: UTP--glucose-1-phosphate uridylyltransferase [Opitutales bacterium]|nr:UTP--glucose-1-phosphate uridylyltransferase [Opitutales bacterium]
MSHFLSLLPTNTPTPPNTSGWQSPSCLSKADLSKHGLNPNRLHTLGERSFQNGEVAFLTVAGGLGTRLGFDGPKGLFPVTPVTGKTLFQVFSEKLRALQQRYGRTFHWLIMTGEETDKATREAFRTHAWYDEAYLHIFKQGTLPAFSTNKQPLLNEDGSIVCLPDGHGGVFKALKQADLLSLLETKGIQTLSYFQVDNPLVRLDDALFLGAHLHQQSQFSTKVVAKTHPEERVGLFVQDGHQLRLVEYSEFPPSLQTARNKDGLLKYRWGNTAIHLLSTDFVQTCANQELPYHVCRKKIKAWDLIAKTVQTTEGLKLEHFIFDTLPQANNPLLWEVAREEEFSPVKNATGSDTPETCRRDQIRRWLRWLKAADPTWLETQLKENPDPLLEISPLFADNKDDFLNAWKRLPEKPKTLHGCCL